MWVILATLVPVFAIMGLGVFADRRQMLPASTAACLNQFVYWFSLPLLLFHQLAILRPEQVSGGVAWGYVLGLGLALLLGYVLFRLLGERQDDSLLLALVGSFPNAAFMGLPVIMLLYPGDAAAAVAASLAVVLTSVNMIFVDTVLGAGEAKAVAGEGATLGAVQTVLRILRSLYHNPIMVCSALGATVGLLNIPLPGPLLVTAKMIGSTASPCALFCMGMVLSAQVAGFSTSRAKRAGSETAASAGVASPGSESNLDSHESLGVSETLGSRTCEACGTRGRWYRRQILLHLFKLVVSPAMVFGVIWLLGGRGTALASATIMAAMATAVVAFVLAEKHGTVGGDVSVAIVLNTALAAVSLPVVILVVQWATS